MATKKEQLAMEVAKAICLSKCARLDNYPTLAHGGLSLLEVLSPFVEISR